jgi:hypothetical protein
MKALDKETKEQYEDYIIKTIMRLPIMDDDELKDLLSYALPVIRVHANEEIARRWAETIMPKDA